MRGLKAPYAMTIEDVGVYGPGMRSRVPFAGIKPWASTRSLAGLGELDKQEKIAVGAGAGLLAWWLISTDKEKYTTEQLKAMAKTQKGAPTDTPGQKLPGAPDYVKIYQGQKIDALRRFGEGPGASGDQGKATPLTTRVFAHSTVVKYWTDEINRLIGLDNSSFGLDHNSLKKISIEDTRDHAVGFQLYPRSMVSSNSANAILDGWNNLRPKLRSVLFHPGVNPLNNMSPEDAVAFWDLIAKMAILVDVDRAVPDHTGYVWIAIRDSATELPGRIGAAALAIASEVGGFGLKVVLSAIKGIVFSPIGVIGGLGAVAYFYSRRKRQGRLAYIVEPRKSKKRSTRRKRRR